MPRFFKPNKPKSRRLSSIDERLLIESFSDDGRGVAHYQGKVVFVEGALPGEYVHVRVKHESSRFMEVIATDIEDRSQHRVSPLCTHAASCGGCSTQHIRDDEQRRFKEEIFIASLEQHLDTDLNQTLPTLYDKGFAYRNRIRLGVAWARHGDIRLGFRQNGQQQLVDINECPVMLPVLARLIKPIKQWLKSLKQAPVTHIELVGHEYSYGVVIRHTRTIPIEHKKQLQVSLEDLGAGLWFQSIKHGMLEDVNGLSLDPRLYYDLPAYNVRLHYHPQDFIQANSVVNASMVEQALNLLKPQAHEHFVDLFCGIGNFSLPLSRRAAVVHGYEGVQSMVDRATANAQTNQCANAHFLQADLGSESASVYDKRPIDGLLLDPPRAGAKVVCTNIARLAPARIVYVSCNMATFTRDAQILCESGYKLTASGLMDMFPQTSHSEVMGLFEHC